MGKRTDIGEDKPLRVLLLSQWYDPEPGHLLASLAHRVQARGHRVQVLTGIPYDESGAFAQGYRFRWRTRETVDGVPVLRVPLFPSHDRSGLRRTLTYGTFAASAATIGAASIEKPDVAYVYHPPATNGLPARVLRLFRGVPFVYHVQDLWPDTLPATGMVNNATVLKMVDAWCRQIYRAADRLIVLSPGFQRKLLERGVPEEKIDVVYNWARGMQERPREPDEAVRQALAPPKATFDILFAGNMGMAQGLEAVVDAARLLQDEAPEIRFVFIGPGVKVAELKAKARRVGADNVLFLPPQAVSQMGRIFEWADVLLVHLKDDPLFAITIPSKTQDYMTAGKPILMGVRGDAAELVARAGAGVSCEPENPHSIAAAALELFRMSVSERKAMGERGRRFYEDELSQARGTGRIADILEQTARIRGRSGRETSNRV